MTNSGLAQAGVAARVVARFCEEFDFSQIDLRQRLAARRELASIRDGLGGRDAALDQALARLGAALALPVAAHGPRRPRRALKLKLLLKMLAALGGAGAGAAMLGAMPALAYSTPAVGATVYNSATGRNEVVAEVIGSPGYAVLTNYNQIIMYTTTVGDTFIVTNADSSQSRYKVTAITPAGSSNPTSITVVQINLDGSAIAGATGQSVAVYRDATQAGSGGGGITGATNPFSPGGSDSPLYYVNSSGGTGGNGSDGGGVRVCIPIIGCATVGKEPTNGGNGGNGGAITLSSGDFGSAYNSVSNNVPAVTLLSNGGNGGRGGDSFAVNISGANGGSGGTGGTINVTIGAGTTITTGGDNSHGIYAQSSGGSGGRAGNGYIGSSGGSGGTAGAGGSITLDNSASIQTTGVGAIGILAQSRGGGAGSGGDSYGIVGDSGNGSSGGGGGSVSVTNRGYVQTTNTYAHGIVAQSIGGFGGTSGNSGGLVASVGSGGNAGSGGSASIHLADTGRVETGGDHAHALLAQSIGGNGGSVGNAGGIGVVGGDAGGGATGGAISVSTDVGTHIVTGGEGSYGILAESVGGNGGDIGWSGGAVTFGGSSGAGNDGGAVSVTANGSIVTSGTDSRGIFAQSVGGGGGNAGNSYGVVTLGGSGGAGGVGKAVSITLGSGSSITTAGLGATGVFAQSVGGGGGSGAFSGGLVALGGSGSVGGAGGTVTVSNAGSITTSNDWARGLFAQSIGGGGGAGGGTEGAVTFGGSGSAASDGGAVTIGNSGSIHTSGDNSGGMFGQSVGGGGGDGGSSSGLLSFGGKAGAGGAGGHVVANFSGLIGTDGFMSNGLQAQSIGGGGGNGGSAYSGSAFIGLAMGGSGNVGGTGGLVEAHFSNRTLSVGGVPTAVAPLITTGQNFSRGVMLQSVGGGGGNGGMAVQATAGAWGAVSFAIGGNGAAGAQGGTVNADGDVGIVTSGDFSEGFMAQSVGGGGGNGGAAVSVALSGGEGVSGSLSVGIGGKAGGGGVGGTVDIDSGGQITTQGSYSTGFVAQSIGGGGGNGGFAVSVSGAGSDGLAVAGSLAIGGQGGTGGVGGTVDASFDGSIGTGGLTGTGHNSHGALIQSVGGGGGSGGFSVAASVTLSGGASVGASVGLGGNGGSGGAGGIVTGAVGGNVLTRGDQSSGVIIQSTGGGGGAGGFNVSGNLAASGGAGVGIAVGLGGAGGGGGDGGKTVGATGGTVETFGDQSDGVLVQSVGGGGGSGGFNISGNIGLGGMAGAAIGVGLGGAGGGAGAGGETSGTVGGDVATHGDFSRGVLVQSVGGGGGAGGFNVTGALTAGGTAAGSIGVGLGGSGGGGGGASKVVASAKSIITDGDDSAGFIAQSVGGGGGTGGFDVTGSMDIAGTGSGNVNVGLGGTGGSGGSSGEVIASLVGTATTLGDRSGAILAQSVGGGGGAGGFNVTAGIALSGTGSGTIGVGIGGSGGTAGNAGKVTLGVTGYSTTDGVGSDGIVAQSIGGGGGNGGFNVTGGLSAAGTGSGAIAVGIGGQGGGGGSAESVTLNVNDGVTTNNNLRLASVTNDDNSAGIVAQSLGGGGGNGGFNVSGTLTFAGTGSGSVNVGVGGSGGAGGLAKSVTADISGLTYTAGDGSLGILAQSIGGGGGNGGFNVTSGLTFAGTGSGTINVGIGGMGGHGGGAGAVALKLNDQVATPATDLLAAFTAGDRSDGIIVQSLGGGGGNGGFNVASGISFGTSGTGSLSVGVGGMGGDGGSAGAASADITGAIGTSGDMSRALLVQSIGGGGGNGGFNVTGNITASKSLSGSLGVGIGGFGGDGGAAGAASLKLNTRTLDSGNAMTSVSTQGDDSAGVIVQSLGGGGGNGGFNVTGNIALSMGTSASIGVGIGGFGGGGGNASTASATINGDLTTQGDRASALLVQSAGGGGGNGGFNVTGGLALSKDGGGNLGVGVGGFGGDGGNASSVTGRVTSDIETHGDDSDGASFQSLGGGGGNGGFNVSGLVNLSMGDTASGNLGVGIGGFGGGGGLAGMVDARLTGNVTTHGNLSHGILAQSVGGGGGNGGFNATGGVSLSKGANGSIGVGIGGFGGGGGNGGGVTGAFVGAVTTSGDDSFGATLQSLGGAGGAGGFNVTGNLSVTAGDGASIAASIGLGGFGGDGGNGGTVNGTVTGRYQTAGDRSTGVLAQSVGGGGGAGGINVSGNITASTGTSGGGGIGIGGFGGGGGAGGSVTLTRTGDTFTDGGSSHGVIAQSVGGGGGAGGINVTGGIAATKGDSAAVTLGFGLGGFGGDGGTGGNVTATITGNVLAQGLDSDRTINVKDTTDYVGLSDAQLAKILSNTVRVRSGGSTGVLVQSVGGGGGAGGMNVTGQLAVNTSTDSPSGRVAAIGIGGFGGSGGNAGAVNATLGAPSGSSGRVQVVGTGDSQMAFAAQSIGGGGGQGGMNISGGISTAGNLTIGIGGFGGAGGKGGNVTAKLDADLFAGGNNAMGFLAQSVGGGGGAGGINISGGIEAATKGKEPVITFGLGGFGGIGNTAGNVVAGQNGQVMVDGLFSYGVLAQSLGGGGGAGGLNVTAAVTGTGSPKRNTEGLAVAAGVGGNGGIGGDAGTVGLTSNGNVFVNTTVTMIDGEAAFGAIADTGFSGGVVAQSIGGGGGAGGMNFTGAFAPNGQPVAIGVGGSGGAGGNGAAVTLTRGYTGSGPSEIETPGLVVTNGDGSVGVMAQSIGGGGGNGGFNLALIGTGKDKTAKNAAALIVVGGSGGSAGNAGDVSVRHLGNIMTGGADSAGLKAQSIAGGGGNASLNLGLGIARGADLVSVTVGGDTGDGGQAGDVTVENDGTILTSGKNSSGIVAESLAGGGGDTGTDMAVAIMSKNSLGIGIGRDGGLGGVGGNVSVTSAGYIGTQGADSNGILAMSTGGAGGVSSADSVGVGVTTGEGDSEKAWGASVAVGRKGGASGKSGDVTIANTAEIQTVGDRSRGIMAQSIGGEGGVGGGASNILILQNVSAGVAIGGDGGDGAGSGRVDVDNHALIHTQGADSDGILAQSLGGGGGVGGQVMTIELAKPGATSGGDAKTSTSATLAVGGGGGTGGLAGAVDVANDGTIATSGDRGFGIRAQSIGGGGGIGGAVLGAHLAVGGNNNALDVNVGGSGGAGNLGGRVDVLNEGLIFTTGIDAAGISANSIGGGGGDAGVMLTLTAGGGGSTTSQHRVNINIGGSGGDGNDGGAVNVINRTTAAQHSGTIVTSGRGAYGIFAQSLGGTGGNSSSILALTAIAGGEESASLVMNIGASGGTGGVGGTVTVDNGGIIDTSGDGAHGVLAQSIGGGGGNGGLTLAGNLLVGSPTKAPAISVGGIGGDGGNGGSVTVNNSGSIVTRGANANGIVAQSIGGGGGNAGIGQSLTSEPYTMVLGNALTALLGATGGGNGGLGGNVTVNHSGDITVLGENSQAIVAESINGGGGHLALDFKGLTTLPGFAYPGGTTSAPNAPDPLVVARAGASGSTNSNAAKVTVNSTGTIGAGGQDATGITLQSIGGGGGSIRFTAKLVGRIDPDAPAAGQSALGFMGTLGGENGSNNAGGDSNSTHSGDLVTLGDDSLGLLLQSIGGGGGKLLVDTSGGAALLGETQAVLGATNETNSAGGNIVRTQSGSIVTLGDYSKGALLQSIGGGGGIAMLRHQILASTSNTGLAAASGQHNMFVPLTTASVTLGANGGSGNNGGAITTSYTGGFTTYGDHSTALLVQSIGAGGGNVDLSGYDLVHLTLGGQGGAQGNGGAINLTNSGAVYTEGAGSHGIVLQSIGGGGGALFGDMGSVDLTLSSANSGNGGAISLAQDGDIAVTGDGAIGILAQSLGGGGGFVDGVFAGAAGGSGAGGSIGIAADGGVIAYGMGSTAIMAQSLGTTGRGAITVDATGDVRGGGGTGTGVALDGGTNNLVTIHSTLSAVSGRAMSGTSGNDRLENLGTTVGNLFLGSGTNVAHTAAGASFVTINTLDLQDGVGSTGLFDNDGTLEMGLRASPVPIDLALGATFPGPVIDNPKTALLLGTSVISQVALDGNFRQGAGGLMAYDVAFGPYASDRINATGSAVVDGTAKITLTWLENNHDVTLISTGAGGTDNGLNPLDTIAIDYGIKANAAGIHLTLATDFAQGFLNHNEQQIGHHLDSSVLVGGGAGIGRLMALIGNLTAGQEDVYKAIFEELDPESLLAPTILQLDSARDFGGAVNGCAAKDAKGRMCVFGGVNAHRLTRKGGEMDVDYGTAARLRGGIGYAFGNGWQMTGAIGIDDLGDLNASGTRTSGKGGTGLNAGIGLTKRFAGERGEAGLALAIGGQTQQIERFQNIFDPGIGKSDMKTRYVGLDGRIGYSFTSGQLFARPGLDLSAVRMKIDAFREVGLQGTGSRGEGSSDWYLAATPKLSAGMKSDRYSLSGTVGYQLSDKGQIVTPMRLVGAPDGSDPAMIRTRVDKQALLVGANADVKVGKGGLLQFGVKGLYGDKVKSESGHLKLIVNF